MIREFAAFLKAGGGPATLVIAGGAEKDTQELIELGEALLRSNVVFLQGVKREKMPSLFRVADAFALASLHEMMPIAVLEAIASGLPVISNDTETFRWMSGTAGLRSDLSEEGAMTAQFHRMCDESVRAPMARSARSHAIDCFSEQVIMDSILEMYEEVLKNSRTQCSPSWVRDEAR